MTLSNLDTLGIGRYDETTPIGTEFSDYMNEGLDSVSAALGTLLNAPVAFTPTWTNLTIGNGSQAWYYQRVRGLVKVWGILTLGSTTSVGSNPYFALPVAGSFVAGELLGRALFDDAGVRYHGSVHYDSTFSSALARRFSVSGANVLDAAVTATAPFTWANGDKLSMQFEYRAA